MTKQEIFESITKNPAFFLATVDDNKPHVRGMLLYKADENGIIFHTGSFKDVYEQIKKNPNAELCFNCQGTQIRISGQLEIIDDIKLKQEIFNSPTRKFLRDWNDNNLFNDPYKDLIVLNLKHGLATTWTMADNFSQKTYIEL